MAKPVSRQVVTAGTTVVIVPKYRRKAMFVGLNFGSRGYCVSTMGLDEAMIREYIRNQEEDDKREEQLKLG